MKFKTIIPLIIMALFMSSCSNDDDEPTYQWKTTWTTSTLSSSDPSVIINTDTIFNGIQPTTESNAIAVIQDPSNFTITTKDKDGKSLIIKDERQVDGDIKFRNVIVHTADSRYLKQEKIVYQKIK